MASGNQPVPLGRDPTALRKRHPGLECFDYSDLAQALRGCDALINLAVVNNDSGVDMAEYRQANVKLVQSLYHAAAASGVKRFVQFSTLRAERPRSRDFYGRSKREAETWLSARSELAVEIVRLSAIRSDRFGGKAAILATLPRWLRPEGLIGALRPEVSLSTVESAVERLLAEPPEGGLPRVTVLADPKDANAWYCIIKRAMDLGFAAVVVLLLWWLLAIIWFLVRFTSSGPGLFLQTRVGKGQRPFTCVKFRTMRLDTAQAGSHQISAAQVTVIGRLLRRLKLDELPQAINLIRGEMSLVGPRPCLPSQTELIQEREKRNVFSIVPGITGWAQMQAIDMSVPSLLAQVDAEYTVRRSVLLDLRIVLQTLRGQGMGDRTAPRD
jgi:lipopolysaccharide/colanic/teichoic acid biosynthesis glycosyltransferase